jgi:hypothetical protein
MSRRLGATTVVGESSPYYLFHPLAAQRAARIVPHAKLIVLLRDPVERAFSHYKERVREGVETLGFEEALAAEPLRLAGEAERLRADPGYYSFAHEHLSYLTQSLYDRPLRAWLDHFSLDSVLILRSEDLFSDGRAVLARVLAFLGLEGELGDSPRLNATSGACLEQGLRERLWDLVAEDVARLEDVLGRGFGWHEDDP